MTRTLNVWQLAERLHVRASMVRKWCTQYGLPHSGGGYGQPFDVDPLDCVAWVIERLGVAAQPRLPKPPWMEVDVADLVASMPPLFEGVDRAGQAKVLVERVDHRLRLIEARALHHHIAADSDLTDLRRDITLLRTDLGGPRP